MSDKKDVWVYMSYKCDPNRSEGFGFFVKAEQVELLKSIAKENRMYFLVENEYDFTGEE